jgi:hypothetical protein
MLGLRNPPRSWTGTVGPSLPDFTIVQSTWCWRHCLFRMLADYSVWLKDRQHPLCLTIDLWMIC